MEIQRRLAGEGGGKGVFEAESAGRSGRQGRREEVDDGLVRAELGRCDEPGEVGGEAGFALGDERVVEPCGGNEGRREDPLGREGACVVEGVVQCREL